MNRPNASQKHIASLEIFNMPGHLVRRLHQASVAIFDNEIRMAGIDLTPVQFAVITIIASYPGLDQANLAQGIAYDRVTIGGVIDRLEQKGLVRRETPVHDRRARQLYLQPFGKDLLEKACPVVQAIQTSMLAGLAAPEGEELCRLLRKALDTVGDISRRPAHLRQSA